MDAVELLDVNIKKIYENMEESENLTVYQGNALDLSFLKSEEYDIVLLLREALSVLKKGGILMNAYCMADAAILMAGFRKGHTKYLIENNMLDPVTFKTHSEPRDVFELYTISDIDRLNSQIPARRLKIVGTDMSAEFFEQIIDNMTDEEFTLYMNYHFTVCERADLIGAGNHTLDILKKE